jgi:hypothetical protein
MTINEILACMTGGFHMRYEGNSNDCSLVQYAGTVSVENISVLLRQGLIESFANSGGYRISNKGMNHYLRSMDELRSASVSSASEDKP